MHDLILKRKIPDIVAEYDYKVAAIPEVLAAFKKAGQDVGMAATIEGTFGNEHIDTGRISDHHIANSLLKSAWMYVYNKYEIARIASAKDKRLFTQSMEKPAPFTSENVFATFGDYLFNERANILRGLAEVFCDLDPAYKSHDKVKIGVKGLPKRVILTGCGSYGHGWGYERVRDMLNALAAYQGKQLVTHQELSDLFKQEDALKSTHGVWLRRFSNGNGHLFFAPDTVRDINMALAEYYGAVLADCADDAPTEKRQSTAVAKDLQYYPTPVAVVDRVLDDAYIREGQKVLEPSCGDGRFLDALRDKGFDAYGIEIDAGRAAQAREKGHSVLVANFLETVPTAIYDHVVMNPPFYGNYYAKHVNHALKFLKIGGKLTAILPITARYDHGLLTGEWRDLPVGSFSESGTNINTTVLTMWKK